MASGDTIAIVTCLAIIAVVYAVVEAPGVIRFLFAGSQKMLRKCRGRFKSSKLRRQKSAELLNIRIAKRLVELRNTYLLGLLRIWMHVCGGYAALGFFGLLVGWTWVTDVLPAAFWTISYVTAVAARCYPPLVNRRTLWIMHSWYMSILMCYAINLGLTDPNMFAQYLTQMLLARVIFSLAYPETLPNVLWNVAWAFMSCWFLVQADKARADVTVSNIIVNEVINAGVLSFVLWRIQLLQISQVRSDLEATLYRREKVTMERLLSDMCDAVVELDPDLALRQGSPKLAGLLFRHTNATALRGEAFPSMIFNERDRERFEEFVTRRAVPVEHEDEEPNRDNRKASSMYMSLRDASGTAVSVQVFHSCHHDPPDEICHIVGVREVEVESVANNLKDMLHETGPTPHTNRDDDAHSVVSAASSQVSAASSGCESGSDRPTLLTPFVSEQRVQSAVGILLDVMTMEIVACTMGFKSLTGPIFFKCKLTDCIVGVDEFKKWMQKQSNAYFSDSKKYSNLKVKLTPPLVRKQGNFVFHADAHVLKFHENVVAADLGVELPDEADNEDRHGLVCVLSFKDVEAHWKGAKKKKGRKVEQMRKHKVNL